MLPRPLSDWIQRLTTNLILVIAVLALPLIPARHVLLPLWPHTVDEAILATADDRAGHRIFLGAGRHHFEPAIVARDRPRSLVVVERFAQSPVRGFLVAVRPSGDNPLEPLPAHLYGEQVSGESLGVGSLVMIRADEEVIEIDIDDVRRLYRPNRFDLTQRIALLWTRVGEQLVRRMGLDAGV